MTGDTDIHRHIDKYFPCFLNDRDGIGPKAGLSSLSSMKICAIPPYYPYDRDGIGPTAGLSSLSSIGKCCNQSVWSLLYSQPYTDFRLNRNLLPHTFSGEPRMSCNFAISVLL